jgi:GcrA cell cycle regulator
MQATNWAPDHSDALRELVAKGLSYSEIAKTINERFGTNYTRNATIGRSKRMGLAGSAKPESPRRVPPKASQPRPHRVRHTRIAANPQPIPDVAKRAEPIKLHCVGIRPRLIPLVDLEPDDCRYPYGGDKEGEAITFCGHPRREGSSYCSSHFRLTREPGLGSQRGGGLLVLRLVKAA